MAMTKSGSVPNAGTDYHAPTPHLAQVTQSPFQAPSSTQSPDVGDTNESTENAGEGGPSIAALDAMTDAPPPPGTGSVSALSAMTDAMPPGAATGTTAAFEALDGGLRPATRPGR